jgi:hypothetical protein
MLSLCLSGQAVTQAMVADLASATLASASSFSSASVADQRPFASGGDYVAKLPEAEHMTAEWQAAMLALMLVVELNGPTMMARIGIMRALNRGYVREFNSSRKDTHWGKRKLKRDA